MLPLESFRSKPSGHQLKSDAHDHIDSQPRENSKPNGETQEYGQKYTAQRCRFGASPPKVGSALYFNQHSTSRCTVPDFHMLKSVKKSP